MDIHTPIKQTQEELEKATGTSLKDDMLKALKETIYKINNTDNKVSDFINVISDRNK